MAFAEALAEEVPSEVDKDFFKKFPNTLEKQGMDNVQEVVPLFRVKEIRTSKDKEDDDEEFQSAGQNEDADLGDEGKRARNDGE